MSLRIWAKHASSWGALCMLSASMAGCGGAEVGARSIAQEEEPGAITLRGELVWGHEARSFSECGSKEVSWVVDETGGEVRRIYEQLASQPYQELFFELMAERRPALESGFGADYPDTVLVREVRRAEAEGWGCREDLTALKTRAFGVEPFWSLKVRASGIVLERLDSPVPTEWPPVRASLAGGTIVYRTAGDSGALEITLIEGRCVDAMAGSLFAYRAEVRLGEEILAGCAVTGDALEEQ